MEDTGGDVTMTATVTMSGGAPLETRQDIPVRTFPELVAWGTPVSYAHPVGADVPSTSAPTTSPQYTPTPQQPQQQMPPQQQMAPQQRQQQQSADYIFRQGALERAADAAVTGQQQPCPANPSWWPAKTGVESAKTSMPTRPTPGSPADFMRPTTTPAKPPPAARGSGQPPPDGLIWVKMPGADREVADGFRSAEFLERAPHVENIRPPRGGRDMPTRTLAAQGAKWMRMRTIYLLAT
jgi:hypothetical protein